jgi:hypothetical protein
MPSCRSVLAVALGVAALAVGRASAQEALTRAMELEQAGRFVEAAEAYRMLLLASAPSGRTPRPAAATHRRRSRGGP